MGQKSNKRVVKRVVKASGDGKVDRVLREFKEGRLKSSDGSFVTDRRQAIAIALSEAGMSSNNLQKAEIINKLRVAKADLERRLDKELESERMVKAEIIKFFKHNPEPKDNEVHDLASRLGVNPDELETQIYRLFSAFINGGLSGGKDTNVDQAELHQGIKVEMEHTSEPAIAEKIARDHLAEDPKYYTKLKAVEAK